MKKIFILLLILFMTINVNARNQDHVSYSLNLNKDYVSGKVSGYATLEGHESGNENTNAKGCSSIYECDLCTDDAFTYTFELEAYALTKNGTQVSYQYLGGDKGEGGDDTYTYCDKDDSGSCLEGATCYNGTMFSISFNLKGLMAENVYGFKLVLTITAHDGYQVEYVINPANENANAKKVAGYAGGSPVIKQLDANIQCSNQLVKTGSKESLMCGSTNEVGINTGENCVNETSNTYYSIACTEQIYVSSTHTNNSNLKGGSGIGHTVIVSSIKECGGTFNKSLWLDDYDILSTGYESADNERLRAYYRNKMDKMESYVNDYNRLTNGMSSYTISADGKFKISYALKNGSENKTLKLVGEETAGEGVFVEKKEVKLGISGVTNPYNFSYTNAEHAATVTLTLPMAYKNTKTGAYSYQPCTNCEEAGNRYYLDKNIDTKAEGDESHKYIKYIVEVSGMGSSKAFDVIYEDCDIQLEGEIEYLYRAIDLKNPFITNLGHKIGLNWKNKYFDFTKVISPTTGSGGYSLSLTGEDVAKIQSSNENNPNAYTTPCSGNNDNACSLIKRGNK